MAQSWLLLLHWIETLQLAKEVGGCSRQHSDPSDCREMSYRNPSAMISTILMFTPLEMAFCRRPIASLRRPVGRTGRV